MATYSEELQDLNDHASRIMIPAIVYVVVLMIMGLIGNPLVVYFYGCKQKPTPSYMFIVTMAIFDMITCSVSMPLEIVDLVRFYTFASTDACRLLRFVNYFASIASGFTLMAIAVDRYRKICKPFKTQISIKMSKAIIVMCIVLSLVLSWPAIVFYRVVEVNVTATSDIVGYDCTTVRDDEYKIYITAFNILLFLLFAISISSIIVLYSLVGHQLCSLRGFKFYAQKSKNNRTKPRPLSSTTNNTDETYGFSSYADSVTTKTSIPIAFSEVDDEDLPLSIIEETSRPSSVSSAFSSRKIAPYDIIRDETRLSDTSQNSNSKLRNCKSMDNAIRQENMASIVTRSNSANNEKLRAHVLQLKIAQHAHSANLKRIDEVETRDAKATANIDQKKLQRQNINTRKYTVVMLSISIAFVISFLPYLGLITWRTLSKDYETNLLTDTQLVAYNIGLRSFLISSAVNPLIYGFLNTEFQNFILTLFCGRCCDIPELKQGSESVNSQSGGVSGSRS